MFTILIDAYKFKIIIIIRFISDGVIIPHLWFNAMLDTPRH